MEQLVNASPLHGSFGELLRVCRLRARLTQEQLAARATLSERAVRNLEAERVRSPRNDTVRLLADALELTGPERGSWFEAARASTGREREPAGIVTVLTGGARDCFCLVMTALTDQGGKTVLAVRWVSFG